MKLNKKGFVLAETLVVAVFMAAIFTIIYVNFYPLIGEYEKREFYDDLDSKYDIYWFKRIVQNKQALPTGDISTNYTWRYYTGPEYVADCDIHDGNINGYCDNDSCALRDIGYIKLIDGTTNFCNQLTTNSESGVNFRSLCNQLRNKTGIQKLYLTTYYLNNPSTNGQQLVYLGQTKYFKKEVDKVGSGFDENFKDYVFYLPDFRYASPNGARFRLVAQFLRHTSSDPALDEPYYSYATIEVNREKGV